jgi:glycosyltransferase involved in cell wall biosynthesis
VRLLSSYRALEAAGPETRGEQYRDETGPPRPLYRESVMTAPAALPAHAGGPRPATPARRAPFVSVVVPVHNTARYLRAAIESVLEQSYPHFELLLVDDGSADASAAIALDYAQRDRRVRVLRNERNLGIVKARNRGFAEADPAATYFAVLDSDDVCMPDRLQRQVEFLEANPDHALVGGHILVVDEHGDEVGARRYPTTYAEILQVITRYSPVAQPTVMIRRSALAAVGVYSEQFPRCHDYDLWLRMAAQFKIANLDAFTLKYRISPTQGKHVHLRESLKFTIDVQRQWLLHRRFFNPANLAYWGAEHLLLLLPKAVVLDLFKRITYRSARAR